MHWLNAVRMYRRMLRPRVLVVYSIVRVREEMRARKCELSTSVDALQERLHATEAMAMCDVCRELYGRFVTALPKPAQPARPAASDDFLGGVAMASENTAPEEEASSGSQDEDGSDADGWEPPAKVSKPQSQDSALAPLQAHGSSRLRPSRQGMHPQGWLSLLRMLSPTRVVTASPVTCHAGLLAAILQHNDERFGLNPCRLVTFCVELPPSPRETEWTKRHMKWWQMSHLCLHSVDAALLGYASMRLKATTSNVGLGVPGPSRLTA